MHGTQPPTPNREQPPKTITDADALADRDDIPYRNDVLLHHSADHCALEIAGRAIVGTRDAEGHLLVATNDEHDVAGLPHADVGPDGDWVAAGRDGVAEKTGLAVEITGVRLVREIDHYVVGEDDLPEDPDAWLREEPPEGADRQVTTHNVLLDGRPVEGSSIEPDAGPEEWTPGWVDGVPENAAPGMMGADLERFAE